MLVPPVVRISRQLDGRPAHPLPAIKHGAAPAPRCRPDPPALSSLGPLQRETGGMPPPWLWRAGGAGTEASVTHTAARQGSHPLGRRRRLEHSTHVGRVAALCLDVREELENDVQLLPSSINLCGQARLGGVL